MEEKNEKGRVKNPFKGKKVKKAGALEEKNEEGRVKNPFKGKRVKR